MFTALTSAKPSGDTSVKKMLSSHVKTANNVLEKMTASPGGENSPCTIFVRGFSFVDKEPTMKSTKLCFKISICTVLLFVSKQSTPVTL